MDFSLNEEQRAVRASVHDFMQDKEVAAWIKQAELNKEFPHEFMRRAAELGYLAMTTDPKYGGAGLDAVGALVAMEEFAYRSVPFSLNILVQNSLAGYAIALFGTEEQKTKYLPKMARGELFGCFANTEPDTGSDAKNIVTHAKKYGNKWVLNGTKRFCTNASEAGIAVVFARTAERKPESPGTTAFLIEIGPELPGYSLDKKEEKIAQHGSTLCEFTLNDVLVDDGAVLGQVGGGWEVCDKTFRHSRIWIAMQGVGVARRALDETIAYCSLRKTFGKPIVLHQHVAFELAKARVALESARLLVFKAACQEADGDPDFVVTASMAKYAAGELAEHASRLCYRYFGGLSISSESISSKLWRDAAIIPVYEGASEIQLAIIAKDGLKAISRC